MIVLGEFIFEYMVLWVFVSEDGGFGVFMNEGTGLGCEREGRLKGGCAHWASPRVSRGDFTKVSRRKIRAGEMYPERQLIHCTDMFPQVTLREQTEQGSIGLGLG